MEQKEIILFSIVAFVVNLIIFYNLVRSATKSNSRLDILYVQARLISMLLIKNGVSPEEIKKIVDQGKDGDGDLIQRDYSKIIPGMGDNGKQLPTQ